MRRQQGLLRPLVPLRDHVSFDRSTQDHSEKPDHSAKCEISFEVSSVHGNSPFRKRRLRGARYVVRLALIRDLAKENVCIPKCDWALADHVRCACCFRAESINRRARCSVTRICPNRIDTRAVCYCSNIVAKVLSDQTTPGENSRADRTGAVGIGGSCADLEWGAKARAAIGRTREISVVMHN